MYLDKVPNRNSPPAILLRESYREDGKVKKRTLANLSALPSHAIDALREALRRGGPSAQGASETTDEPFRIRRSKPHGHVKVVLEMMRKLGVERLLGARKSRCRSLVMGMIAARILFPESKLQTVSRWNQCTLAEELGIQDADENELYKALDWLLERKESIENKLAKRHVGEGDCVL